MSNIDIASANVNGKNKEFQTINDRAPPGRLKIEFTEAKRHLELLGVADGDSVFVQTFADAKNANGEKPGCISARQWAVGHEDQEIESLVQHQTDRGAGVFIAVNEATGRKRQSDNVGRIRAVWGDFDQAARKPFPIEPTFVVETSPGKQHAYWVCDGLSHEEALGVLYRIAQEYGADENATDLTRVLRLAGSWNQKQPGRAVRAKIVAASGKRYTRDEILAAFPPATKGRTKTQRAVDNLKAGLGGAAVAFEHPRIQRAIDEACRDISDAAHGQQEDTLNRAAFKIGAILNANGLSAYSEQVAARLVDAGMKMPNQRGRAPWSRDEIADKVSRGLNDGIAKGDLEASEISLTWPDLTKAGAPVAKSQANIRHALDALGTRLSKNEMSGKHHIEGFEAFDELHDEAMRALRMRVDALGLQVPREFFEDVVLDTARQNGRHPLKEELSALQESWDGTSRLDDWLVRYAGAEDTALNRAFGRLWLIAAVRRVRRPGVKFDHILTLIGPQGAGKSSLARVLAGADYFEDNLSLGADAKVILEQMAGRWIGEVSELRGYNREADQIKAMLSRTHDTARPAYARSAVTVPRQWVLIGTVNQDTFLTDATGNRRFWPVEINRVDLESLRNDRDQLLAEAAYLEASGGSIELPQALWGAANAAQGARLIEDPISLVIHEALGDDGGDIDMDALWSIVGLPDDERARRQQKDLQAIGRAMSALGWTKVRYREDGTRRYAYKKTAERMHSFEIGHGGNVVRGQYRLGGGRPADGTNNVVSMATRGATQQHR